MAAESGINVLLQVGPNPDDSPQVFTTLGGQQNTQLTINSATDDITDKSNQGWGGTLATLNNATITVSGVIDAADTIFQRIRTVANARTPIRYRCLIDIAGDYYEGSFNVTSFEETGAHDGATRYSITLQNDGVVNFVDI